MAAPVVYSSPEEARKAAAQSLSYEEGREIRSKVLEDRVDITEEDVDDAVERLRVLYAEMNSAEATEEAAAAAAI